MHTSVRPQWRLLITPPASGAWNMAVDEAIAVQAGAGRAPTTLRFYQWDPPCVSLGRHQPLADLDLRRCRELGYEVVRRPTGGRAILHVDELTYSVAGPAHDPLLAGAVLDSYRRLSQGLLAGLLRLGLAAGKAPAGSRAGTDNPICFDLPSAYEIVAGDRKLLGSAQSRRRGWVLQHGSLPLAGEITRLVDVLALAEEERTVRRRELGARATTLQAVSGRPIDFAEAAQALAAGFSEALGVRLAPGDLTPLELEMASTLRRAPYGDLTWTARW